MTFLLLCLWGACIICAFLGYGSAIIRALGIANPSWPLAGTVGISFAVFLGGFLNLGGFIGRPTLIGLVVVGDLLAAVAASYRSGGLKKQFQTGYRELTASPGGLPLAMLIILLLAVPVLGNIRMHPGLMNFDDFSAYLALPAETLQIGTLPFDPFNERRITSSLGAAYFLQTFTLILGDVRTIPFMDVGVGALLYCATMFSIFRTLKLSLKQSLALLLLLFAAQLERANLTMHILPAALFAALFLIEIHPALGVRAGWRRSVLLGLIAGTLCCLKSNYLPPALLICGLYYVAVYWSERSTKVFASFAVFVLVVAVCVLPWMIDLKQKEGTYLFPILGLGYDASAYGLIPLPSGSRTTVTSVSWWVWLALAPMAGPLFLALIPTFAAFRKKLETESMELLSYLLATGVGVVAVAASVGGDSVGRYTLPFQVPALLIFTAFVLRWRTKLPSRPPWLTAAYGLVAVTFAFIIVFFGIHSHTYWRYLQDAGLFVPAKRFDMDVEKKRVADLQATVPSGERLLTRLFVSYPLDFKRNPVFLADYVGMAGLPPGMPVGKGPEPLRSYLLGNSIRYIAYDRKRIHEPDDDPAASLQAVLSNPKKYGRRSWHNLQSKVSEDERDNFEALSTAYKHVYDDGLVYVLDLQSEIGPTTSASLSRRQ